MRLAIDLFTGLHGWAEGLVAEGWEVVGFDLEDMSAKFAMPKPANFHLVIQDVLSLHGSQFKRAELIVASPPCQEFSWMAMPWTRAKKVAAALRGEGEFPEGYNGSRTVKELTALFDSCFRIQREASAAAGYKIPMVVENVRGAQPWVGRAKWMFGSFALYGDVPALMPIVRRANVEATAFKTNGMNWSDRTKRGQDFTRIAGNQAIKNNGGSWFAIAHNKSSGHSRNPVNNSEGIKQGGEWWHDPNGLGSLSSRSSARKQASAMIAKIPFPLANWIAKVI